jgi:hypothetical protein
MSTRRIPGHVRLSSWVFVAVTLASLGVSSCDGATPHRGNARGDAASASFDPTTEIGTVARAATIELSPARDAHPTLPPTVAMVAGTLTAAEQKALTAGKPSAALRARLVPLMLATAADAVTLARPTAPIDVPLVTLFFDDGLDAPLVTPLVVVDGPPLARKIWPRAPRPIGDATPWLYCWSAEAWASFDGAPPLEPTTSSFPHGLGLTPAPRAEGPCVDLRPSESLVEGDEQPPATLAGGALALDPSPIAVRSAAPSLPAIACAAPSIALGAACLRIEDDRAIIGADAVETVVLGALGERSVLVALSPGQRAVVHGLAPARTITLALESRSIGAPVSLRTTATTAAARAHLVVSEALCRPPSGLASQRFVELVNDSDLSASLAGYALLDGESAYTLPTISLAAHEYLLIVPAGFVDGLGGDVAPPRDVQRLRLPSLRLSKRVALIDADGSVVSTLPLPTRTTKNGSRGRRSDDSPDDAIDAFGWDADERATPGAPNHLAPATGDE